VTEPGDSRPIRSSVPNVSIIMPVRECAQTLVEAVDAALGQGDLVGEVVLAVAPSRDDTVAVAQRLAASDARVHLTDNPSGRTPDGLNAAIAASSGDVVVRVDAHAVIPPGYVAQALRTLASTGAANVGGRQVPVSGGGFAGAVAAAMRSPFGAGGAAYRTGTEPGPADTVYLGTFRKDVLEAVGGYDGRFTRNQDAELNLRLRRAGYEVWFDPRLAVEYRPRDTVRGLASQYLQYGRWRRLTGRVHRRSLATRQLAAPAVVLALLGAAAASVAWSDWRPIIVVSGGYVMGLLGAGAMAADHPRSAGATALALGTMHLSWGVGFLIGPPRGAARRLPTDGYSTGVVTIS
jgi:succinoglycan biosynthesis protein ExoA